METESDCRICCSCTIFGQYCGKCGFLFPVYVGPPIETIGWGCFDSYPLPRMDNYHSGT